MSTALIDRHCPRQTGRLATSDIEALKLHRSRQRTPGGQSEPTRSRRPAPEPG